MQLRSRDITSIPREEVDEMVGRDTSTQESGESNEAQVGSPASTRTDSFTRNVHPTPSSPIVQDQLSPRLIESTGPNLGSSSALNEESLGSNASYFPTRQGLDSTPTASTYLTPRATNNQSRHYRPLAPRLDPQLTPTPSTSSTITTTTALRFQQAFPSMHTQLPTPLTNMIPHFQTAPGPWSPTSPTVPESRKRSLMEDIPDIEEFPKDRTWDDKMQEELGMLGGMSGDGDDEVEAEGERRGRKRRRSRRIKQGKNERDTAMREQGRGADEEQDRGNATGMETGTRTARPESM